MKIKATQVLGKELKVGDLFSTANQLYWDNMENKHSIREKVYIRTEEPCPKDQENEKIYKIEIIKL